MLVRFGSDKATAGPLRIPSRRTLTNTKRQAPNQALQPVVKVWLHSTGDASSLAALLLAQILPVFSVVAPCQRGASPVSVRRQTFTTGCSLASRLPRMNSRPGAMTTVRVELSPIAAPYGQARARTSVDEHRGIRKQHALSERADCDRTVIRQARNLEEHRGLRTHTE